MAWPVEHIPDGCSLYLRVHRNEASGPLKPTIFREHKGGMSTDWDKYATPHQTRANGTQPPTNYGVVTLPVDAVRSVNGLSVVHSPLDSNRAHTDVVGIGISGPATTERRLLLWHRFSKEWTIHPDAPVAPDA